MITSLGRPVIGEGAIIKENAMIQCHYTNKATRQEERLIIGKGAIVEPWSFVDRPVPDDTIVSGWPAKPLVHAGESIKAMADKVHVGKAGEKATHYSHNTTHKYQAQGK